jgi:3-oxoacyl-[acyl-carrier protein] reductase
LSKRLLNGKTRSLPPLPWRTFADISPSPEMVHYSATKTMQLSLSRSLAELTKGTTVTINTVMPGSTKTEGVARLVQEIFPGMSLEEAVKRFNA